MDHLILLAFMPESSKMRSAVAFANTNTPTVTKKSQVAVPIFNGLILKMYISDLGALLKL